jgi:TRAP-type C4-dicarboxylate transport system permease small subunit
MPATGGPRIELTQRLVRRVLGLALLAVVALNLANAAGRSVLSLSLTGSDEAMVYVMIWVVMAGAAVSLATRSHIAVDLVPGRAGPARRRQIHLLHDAVAVAVCGYATWASWGFVRRIAGLGTESMGLGVPMWLPHAGVLAGLAAMTAIAAVALVRGLGAVFGADGGAGGRRRP